MKTNNKFNPHVHLASTPNPDRFMHGRRVLLSLHMRHDSTALPLTLRKGKKVGLYENNILSKIKTKKENKKQTLQRIKQKSKTYPHHTIISPSPPHWRLTTIKWLPDHGSKNTSFQQNSSRRTNRNVLLESM